MARPTEHHIETLNQICVTSVAGRNGSVLKQENRGGCKGSTVVSGDNSARSVLLLTQTKRYHQH